MPAASYVASSAAATTAYVSTAAPVAASATVASSTVSSAEVQQLKRELEQLKSDLARAEREHNMTKTQLSEAYCRLLFVLTNAGINIPQRG